MRLIVLPQAMRVIIPPTGNETISMLKNTSLVLRASPRCSTCCSRLSRSTRRNFKTIPLLIVASIWYLAMTSVLYVGQYFIERRYGRGFSRRAARHDASALAGQSRQSAGGGCRMSEPMVKAEGVHKRFGASRC